MAPGEVAEWFKAQTWKVCKSVSSSTVRIRISPLILTVQYFQLIRLCKIPFFAISSWLKDWYKWFNVQPISKNRRSLVNARGFTYESLIDKFLFSLFQARIFKTLTVHEYCKNTGLKLLIIHSPIRKHPTFYGKVWYLLMGCKSRQNCVNQPRHLRCYRPRLQNIESLIAGNTKYQTTSAL